MKVLILEDNQSFAKRLKILLEQENYSVVHVSSIKEVENITFRKKFNLYLFNIHLPDGNSLDFLEMLRFAEDHTSTFFMSASEDMNLLKKAFHLDAFDYIKKPFNPIELLIRIDARFKEKNIIYKHIEFNPQSKIIRVNKKVIDIGVVPTNIFYKLIKDTGSIVRKEELMECLDHPSENALRVAISKIKQRLKIEIKNIRAKGYLIETINQVTVY
jgi:DNA-binding response OmpR family regulator